MPVTFFRADRGLEIVVAPNQTVQILTDSSPPDTQPDAQNAPIGSLWIIRDGDISTTGVYQKYQDVFNDNGDWRNLLSTSSWRQPVRATDTTLWANIAATETALNDITSPGNIGGIPSTLWMDGDRVLVTDLTVGNENIYTVNGTPGFGATLQETANVASAGDITYTIEGTYATSFFFHNGTAWGPLGGTGSAIEEGFIRTFIGKGAPGPETPDYANPTGGGPFVVGNIIGASDNLELAIAGLNAFVYQNNAEIKGTNVLTVSDTLPVGVNMARWIVRVNRNSDPTRARAREIFAIRDNTNNVDFSSSNLLNVGGAITNLSFSVTSVGSQLILTVSASVAFDYEIKRLAAVGP